jgi:hypothetical protein
MQFFFFREVNRGGRVEKERLIRRGKVRVVCLQQPAVSSSSMYTRTMYMYPVFAGTNWRGRSALLMPQPGWMMDSSSWLYFLVLCVTVEAGYEGESAVFVAGLAGGRAGGQRRRRADGAEVNRGGGGGG